MYETPMRRVLGCVCFNKFPSRNTYLSSEILWAKLIMTGKFVMVFSKVPSIHIIYNLRKGDLDLLGDCIS